MKIGNELELIAVLILDLDVLGALHVLSVDATPHRERLIVHILAVVLLLLHGVVDEDLRQDVVDVFLDFLIYVLVLHLRGQVLTALLLDQPGLLQELALRLSVVDIVKEFGSGCLSSGQVDVGHASVLHIFVAWLRLFYLGLLDRAILYIEVGIALVGVAQQSHVLRMGLVDLLNIRVGWLPCPIVSFRALLEVVGRVLHND